MKRLSRTLLCERRRSRTTSAARDEGKPSALSQRGEIVAAKMVDMHRILKVQSDQYDPVANPNGYINLGIAENFVMFDYVRDYINKNLSISNWHCSYALGSFGSLQLRQAMAQFWNENCRPYEPIESDHVVFVNGCSSLCEMIGWTMADPGDAVLMNSPIYGNFHYDFTLKAGVHVEFVSTGKDHPTGPDSVQHFEKSILELLSKGIRPRALLICNPHNPLGSFYSEETLIGFCNLCAKYGLHLISDEVYALTIFSTTFQSQSASVNEPGSPFVSLYSLSADSHNLSISQQHIIYGLSKDFAASGLRLGCLISRSNTLVTSAMKVLSLMHYPSSLSDEAAVLMLKDKKWQESYFAESRRRLRRNYDFAIDILERSGIKYFSKGEAWMAGLFLWLDLTPFLKKFRMADDDKSGLSAEGQILNKLFEAKVYANSGSALYSEKPGYMRLIFSQEPLYLKEGLIRLVRVLKGNEAAEKLFSAVNT